MVIKHLMQHDKPLDAETRVLGFVLDIFAIARDYDHFRNVTKLVVHSRGTGCSYSIFRISSNSIVAITMTICAE